MLAETLFTELLGVLAQLRTSLPKLDLRRPNAASVLDTSLLCSNGSVYLAGL